MTSVLSRIDADALTSALGELAAGSVVVREATVGENAFDDGVVVTLYLAPPPTDGWSTDDMRAVSWDARRMVADALPGTDVELTFADRSVNDEASADDDSFRGQPGGGKKRPDA